MSTVVAKFGGTSVANAAQIKKVAVIVRADERRRIVVVSAPGKRDRQDEKITDTLIACHALAARGRPFRDRFAPISDRFRELARQLGIGGDMNPWVDEVEDLIASGADQSAVVSRGEYLCAHMIARYLNFEFVDATEIIEFSDATTVDAAATDRRIVVRLNGDGRYVIPGFYGGRTDGSVQLFTRGGSDISAALVARGIGAESYENWTDVSGLLSADPRIVDSPRPIAEVSYRRLRELSFLGAAVFHEEAVSPAASRSIPIVIRNTNAPDHPGTTIAAASESEPRITGVAGRDAIHLVSVERSGLGKDVEAAGAIGRAARDAGVALVHLGFGADSGTALVAATTTEALDAFLGAIPAAVGCDNVAPPEAVAMVGVVGENVARSAALMAAAVGALEAASIPVMGVTADYSPFSFFFVVPDERYAEATKALYGAAVSG